MENLFWMPHTLINLFLRGRINNLLIFIKNILRASLECWMAFVPRYIPEIKNKKRGINLIGHSPDRGLGIALESIYQSIKNKIPVYCLILPPLFTRKENTMHPMNLFVGNPLMTVHAWINFPKLSIYSSYNVGYFFWELESPPKSWIKLSHWFDEIWVESDFMLRSFKKLSPRVFKIPFAIHVECNKDFNRHYFKLPAKKFIFLFTFDFWSFYQRKNPEAVVSAFKKAFGHRNDVYLFIKSSRGELFPNEVAKLKSAIGISSNIEFKDLFMTKVELSSLIQQCNAYISLHRSEGLGLAMAEAMSLGKPVIATHYSGNLEFMNLKNSCLVNFKKVPVQKDSYLYFRDQMWAEPNIEDAAQLMIKVKENKVFREKIAKQAKIDMKAFTHKNQAAAILKRLDVIYGK